MSYIGITIIWVLFWLIPVAIGFYAVYFLTTIPLRRQERARFFLDLVEAEVKRGSNVEQAIVNIAQSRDHALGARFYLVAAYLETGMRLAQALEKVPRFLPPQISAMLKAGEQAGDMKRVLPVCRNLLHDAQSRTQSAFNYLMILAFVMTPVVPYIYVTLHTFVMPKYLEIFEALGDDMPQLTLFIHAFGLWVAEFQLLLAGIIYLAAFVYAGGPRVWGWLQMIFGPRIDGLMLLVPWRRKQLERNFSAMLALLLDANLPEPAAVKLAAESTANGTMIRNGAIAMTRLSQGSKLSEALSSFDRTGELRWRIANASHAHGGFQAALGGWHDALDAKAYQQEQAASQFITTGLVLLNGLLVGLLIVGVFQVLITLVNKAVLW